MSLTTVVTDSAQHDVAIIVAWLHKRSPSGAETWFDRWQEMLRELPTRARGLAVAPEDATHPEKIQQVFFKTRRGRMYRALFVIRETTIYILHVRGPGQDLMRPDEIQMLN